MIKPTNDRILATELSVEKGELGDIPGTNAQLDKYMKATVVKSEDYKRGTVIVVPSYVDRFKDGKKEYLIVHKSDVVAICE